MGSPSHSPSARIKYAYEKGLDMSKGKMSYGSPMNTKAKARYASNATSPYAAIATKINLTKGIHKDASGGGSYMHNTNMAGNSHRGYEGENKMRADKRWVS